MPASSPQADLLSDELGLSRVPEAVRIGEWPTPVRRLAGLSSRLGADVWVKCDDVSGRPWGGNKVRKLEFLLGDAIASGRAGVATVGGIGSNHVLATGVHAGALGLGTRAVLFPHPVGPSARGMLERLATIGVGFHRCPARPLVPLALALASRRTPGFASIGPGGSSPLGCLGYVAGALELAAQIRSGELPAPDAVFLAYGSGGTVAGLAVGLDLAGLTPEIHAVAVVERVFANVALARLLASRTAALLGRLGARASSPGIRPVEIRVDHSHVGGGYARPTSAAENAVAIASAEEGLRLETTYTGKAMAGLVRYCAGPGRGRRVLFWNTHSSYGLECVPAGPHPAVLPGWLGDWLDQNSTVRPS